MRLACATNNGDARLICDPFWSPFTESSLHTLGALLTLLLACLFGSLLLFLFCWPHLFTLIDVDKRGRVFFSGNHDHSDHLVTISLIGHIAVLDTDRTEVENNRASFSRNSSYYERFTSSSWSVEEE